MKIGMIGLGKMGGNMVTRLLRGGYGVVVHDLSEEAIARAEADGATGVRSSLAQLAPALPKPRADDLLARNGHQWRNDGASHG